MFPIPSFFVAFFIVTLIALTNFYSNVSTSQVYCFHSRLDTNSHHNIWSKNAMQRSAVKFNFPTRPEHPITISPDVVDVPPSPPSPPPPQGENGQTGGDNSSTGGANTSGTSA